MAPDPIADKNNASDGDTLIAWALLRAQKQWQDKVEPFHAREHHLATGESHHRRLQQGGGDGVRGNRIALILPLLLRAQQRPGDQGIAIGGVVFIGDRVRRHRVIG